ncbi:MAG: hypothetical protein ACRDTX_24835 [Pseudonocardiaceae bacterium]
MSQQPPPMPDAAVSEPVTLINAFTVPPAESERYIRARMYRSLVDDAELRFINVAEWDSGTALDQARANPEWRASMHRVLDDPELHIKARPVVYQVAIDVHPGDPLES